MAKSNWEKHAKKAVKKANRGIVLIAIISLLIGFVGGYTGAMYLCQNDCFVLNGKQTITVPQGSDYCYSEEGAKVISFGRDLSDAVVIASSLTEVENGGYLIDTSAEKTYVITYTIDDIKYGSIQKIRTIQIIGDTSEVEEYGK